MNKRGYQGGYWPIIRCAALCGALVVASQGDWLSAEVTESKQVAWVLPNGRASFGAAVIDNWVYVYGGHTGRRHQYSVDDISGKFWRARLNEGGWEELPSGPKLQGLALVAHNGHLYRVGGLTAYNQPNENEQKESTSTVARYLPYEMRWEELTPLPEPRSSHDAIVLDGKLYVVGGWQLTQEMATTEQWHPNAYVADLSQDPIVWQTLPEPPFRRRALAVAAANGRIVAVGGMNDEESVTNDAHYFDVASGTWNQGPDFPAQSRMKAFGASAFGVGDHVYASAGEGILYRLSAAADRWEPTNFTLQQRRFFHRLIADGNDSLLFIGGAARRGMIDHIEMVQLDQVKVGEPISTEQPTETQADASSDASTSVWPGFRGHGDSHSDAKRLPLHWSPDENIAWSAQVPGYGQSSPVVWRNRVVVTSVDGPKKEHLIVSCFDMSTGDVYWRRRVSATQKIDNDDYHSKAAPTPCVDDNGVYVFFESGDLISLDHEGNNRWQRSLTGEYGNFLGNHGVGSSLAATDDTLILLIDHAGPGYLLCVDKATGNNRWKIEREKRVSWSSPIINTYDGRLQIVISSNGVAEAFDAKTGARIWYVEGLKKNTVASPTVAGDTVIIAASDQSSNLAIKQGGTGNVTDTHIRWTAESVMSSFASPLVHQSAVYYVNKAGVISCVDLKTGKRIWRHRLSDSCWASPIAVGSHLYFFSKDGTTTIFEANLSQPVEVAQCKLSIDGRVYGVAAVEGNLLVRTGTQLICIKSA